MAKISRRQFLKLSAATAGMGLLAGCGVKTKGIGGGDFVAPANAAKSKNWGMLIDSDKLSEGDINRMRAACHKAHNVPDIPDKKHEIKWIWEEPFEALFRSEVSPALSDKWRNLPMASLCNQCRKPICVKVCPTQATFTNKEGIVIQDMHRCIGCRNCMAACPYGSRSFNFVDPRPYIKEINPEYPTRSKGVVEKCDFCVERLAKGQLPICVEEAHGAILFGDLDDPNSEIAKAVASEMVIAREPGYGTEPKVFYRVNLKGGGEA